jgi:serine/threonine protein phosphatase PrpC
MGNRASKFVSRHLQSLFHILAVDAVQEHQCSTAMETSVTHVLEPLGSESWLDAYSLRVDKEKQKNGTEMKLQEVVFDATHTMYEATIASDEATEEDNLLSADVWKLKHVVDSLHRSFVEANSYLERNHALYPNDVDTGTTATVVLLFPTVIVVANVGDSRAVLCCDRPSSTSDMLALPLTVDHTPYNKLEKSRIESLGGSVVNTGEKLRVNGAMAVTRSIGDFPFGPLLTAEPDIFVFNRHNKGLERGIDSGSGSGGDPEVNEAAAAAVGDTGTNPCVTLFALQAGPHHARGSQKPLLSAEMQQFIVLASDGLFDVMTNDEVVYFVCNSLVDISKQLLHSSHVDGIGSSGSTAELPIDAFHIAAKQLAQEAYVRGSSDNIGVCIINLLT